MVFNPFKKSANQPPQTTEPDLKTRPIYKNQAGKFISKKEWEELQNGQQVSQEPAIKTKTTAVQIITSQFYGQTIRRYYDGDSWYFVLEDLLPLAQVIDPSGFVISEELDKIPGSKNYDGLICLDYPTIISTLLPKMRQLEHIFPGPFPDWLKGVAEQGSPA